MKKIVLPSLLTILLISFAAFLQAQTGPGGVGNASSNILWLDASNMPLNNGDSVSIWSDVSGNNNDAYQNNPANQPFFRTNHINGKAALHFVDGGNDYLNLTNHITTNDITAFLVYRKERHNQPNILQIKNHTLRGKNNSISFLYKNKENTLPKGNNSYHIVGMSTSTPTDTGTINFWNGNNFNSEGRSGFITNNFSTIGAPYNGQWTTYRGHIAEVILYNKKLSSTERRIVSEYLGIKYNLTSESDLFTYRSSHNEGLIGIGKESDGSNSTANDRDKLTIDNPSQLDNGEYFLVAHNDSGYTTSYSVPLGYTSRWKQTWRVSEVGEVGQIKFTFSIGSDSLNTAGEYVLLVDDDGDFTNGGSHSYDYTNVLSSPITTLEFNGVNLDDGAYFTLASKLNDITSVTSGGWNTPTTWSCNCVPNHLSADVIIDSLHTVIINNDATVNNLTINGTLTFASSDTLFLHGDLIFGALAAFNAESGTIFAVKNLDIQVFENNTTDTLAFYNLAVDAHSGLELTYGDWSIENNVQVLQGGLDASNANSVTLLSSATKTSQILPSMEDAFSGEFIVQRHISTREPNYANLSAPISNATVADLDDEAPNLILSGVNGNHPDIVYPNSTVFYSMFFYDAPNKVHQTITSTSTALTAGRGFELYLLDATEANFTNATVDFKGTPNSGAYYSRVYLGWNLLGNPYHAFLNFNSISKHRSLNNEYQVFNTKTGTYDLFSGASLPYIAPSQGFWVHGNTGGSNGRGVNFNIKETHKVNSNAPDFKRIKKYVDPYFNLSLRSKANDYQHKMRLAFDAFASAGMDEGDLTLLPSPIEEAPAITSRAENSTEELIVNNLNPNVESQLLPIDIYAGVDGAYEITADNLAVLYDNYSCVFLKDKETNSKIDLMVEPTYAFNANKGKSKRFDLILSNSYENCQHLLDEGSFEQNLNEQLSLRNAHNQWHVDYTLGEEITQLEVRIYNMQGQLVKATESFQASGAGTYQLQNTENLKGIYLIQVVGKNHFVNQRIKF